MSRKRKGSRALGPYPESDGCRLVLVEADGSRSTRWFKTEREAARFAEVFNAEAHRADRTIGELLTDYLEALKTGAHRKDRKPRSPSGVKLAAWSVGRFFPSDLQLAELTHARCEALYEAVRTGPAHHNAFGKTLAVDSHRSALLESRQFCAWLVTKRYLAANPCEGITPVGDRRPGGKTLGKAGNKIRTRDTRAFYAAGLAMADEGDTGAIAAMLALLCAMRAGEVVRCRVGDLDNLEDDELPDTVHVVRGKTRKAVRELEIPAPLRPFVAKLAEGREPDAYLFPSDPSDGGRKRTGDEVIPHRSVGWVRRSVHRVCARAGIPSRTAHAMRTAHSSALAERGITGSVVAATLGHTSYDRITARHYVSDGAIERGAARQMFEVLDGGKAKRAG